jgi:threonine synthase
MRYASSRGTAAMSGFGAALLQGLPPMGPLRARWWPALPVPAFAGATDLPAVAARLLAPFAQVILAHQLNDIITEAFNFPAPASTSPMMTGLGAELFHGPTSAFKDFGARFLAAAFARLHPKDAAPLSILVATSGDTGGAVAAAFHQRPGIRVVVLFPKGLVSPTQERQLTCWGDNVRSLSVRGTFDDCQGLVKEAFLDPSLSQVTTLSSANSINLGRLLPRRLLRGHQPGTLPRAWRARLLGGPGNLGNVVFVCGAADGPAIGEVVLAHNANRAVPDYLASGGAPKAEHPNAGIGDGCRGPE